MEVVSRRCALPDGQHWALLSQREREIARCVADGATNKGIAHELGISEKTVEKHLTNIFAKLRLRSRAQLLLLIVRGGGSVKLR